MKCVEKYFQRSDKTIGVEGRAKYFCLRELAKNVRGFCLSNSYSELRLAQIGAPLTLYIYI